ncbi:MAG: hypothetical protein HY078_13055 [Elusimicrobia bacterium]|nr:hypothetical protein [Elusimicrobiota bacterium]
MRTWHHCLKGSLAAGLLAAIAATGAVAGEKDFYTQAPAQADFTPEEIADAKSHPDVFKLQGQKISIESSSRPIEKPQFVQPEVLPKDGVDIGAIVNTLLKVWDIIKANAPVVDITRHYANAMPEGATWTRMAGWKPPEGKDYSFKATNKFGGSVVEVKYQVLRTYGGGYVGTDGVKRGKYLTGVTIQPLNVYVAWGYRFSMKASVPDVINVSETTQDPIAGMTVNVLWTIDTPLQHQEGTGVYYVQGDGMFREIGGPFKEASIERTERRVEGLRSGLLTLPGAQKLFN